MLRPERPSVSRGSVGRGWEIRKHGLIGGFALSAVNTSLTKRQSLANFRKTLLACPALVITLVASAAAFAEMPRPVRLDYERLDGAALCPDNAAIRAGVAARLGYEPFRDQADDQLRATIRQAGHVLEARIELTDAQGKLKAERRLVSRNRDCAELASSVELAIAIAIDPVGSAPPRSGENPPESSTAGVARAGAPRDGDSASTEASTPPTGSSSTWPPTAKRVEVGLLGGLQSAPAANLGFQASAGLQSGAVSLGLEARVDLPASAPLRVGEASASLVVASLVPCAHAGMVATCVLVTGGAQRVAGRGLLDSRHATLPYLGFGVRLAFALPVTARMSLALHGDVTAPVTETKLTVDDSVVWTSPPVAFALGLGVAIRFP